MAGPWEKYAKPLGAAPAAGPWAKYARPKQQAPQAGDPEVFKTGPTVQRSSKIEWEDIPGMAAESAPGSALNVAAALIRPVTHPIETAETMTSLPGGAVREVARAVLPEQVFSFLDSLDTSGDDKEVASQNALAVGNFYKDRYGSVEGFKKALATDPVGVAADLATVFTGGQAAVTRMLPAAKAVEATSAVRRVAPPAVTGKSTRQIAKHAPTREAVQAATDDMYGKLRSAGIVYDADAYQRMGASVLSKLNKQGFRKAQAPMTADALEAVAEQIGKSPDFNDLESIRKTTSNILRDRNASDTDKAAASILLDEIDDFSSRSPFVTDGSIAPADVQPLMTEAREMGRRNILAKQIEDMFAKAETYQSGYEAGLRNQFSNYLRSNKAKSLTREERAAFIEAAKGNFTNNLLGSFGRLGVDFSNLGNRATLLPGGAAGLGVAAGEPVTGAAVVAAATGAKYLARKGTQKAAERASQVVLAGRNAQRTGSRAQQVRAQQIQAMIRQLVASDVGARAVAPLETIHPALARD